jgi:UDP-N-acetylmuramate--alanine ligase
VLVSPVYAAGEAPIEGASAQDLVDGIKARGHRSAQAFNGPEEIAALVRGLAKPGDYVICLGAGTITQWAYDLPKQLAG